MENQLSRGPTVNPPPSTNRHLLNCKSSLKFLPARNNNSKTQSLNPLHFLTFSPPNHHDHRHSFSPLPSTPHQKTPNPNVHRPSLPLLPQTHTNCTQFHLQTPTKKVHSQSRRRRRRWRARWLWHGRGRSGGTGQ